MTVRFDTRSRATIKRAPPLGHFVTRTELTLLRDILQRGDKIAVDSMLASILARRPRMPLKGELS